jgi:hypothetical protein
MANGSVQTGNFYLIDVHKIKQNIRLGTASVAFGRSACHQERDQDFVGGYVSYT